MRICQNLDLTNYNSYRVKAVCKVAYFPEVEADLSELYQARKAEQKVLLGSGHNVILAREYYDESFIIFSGNYDKVTINDNIITAETGVTMLHLSELALEKGLSGLEIFFNIPSSLGGAVVMNAGASGEEIKDLLVSVRYYNPQTDTFHDITKAEIGFEYRNSFFQRNPYLVVTAATLELKHGTQEAIRGKMHQIKEARLAKQPQEYPNAGSVFKRPPGYFVGKLIDDLQLKGFAVGDARISEKHGGFIINTGKASGNDIVQLIDHVKRSVREKFELDLEIEQRIL
jgi:UDP-N-acetylmuramate dehydrogenase